MACRNRQSGKATKAAKECLPAATYKRIKPKTGCGRSKKGSALSSQAIETPFVSSASDCLPEEMHWTIRYMWLCHMGIALSLGSITVSLVKEGRSGAFHIRHPAPPQAISAAAAALLLPGQPSTVPNGTALLSISPPSGLDLAAQVPPMPPADLRSDGLRSDERPAADLAVSEGERDRKGDVEASEE
jgi:hypothetical protein